MRPPRRRPLLSPCARPVPRPTRSEPARPVPLAGARHFAASKPSPPGCENSQAGRADPLCGSARPVGDPRPAFTASPCLPPGRRHAGGITPNADPKEGRMSQTPLQQLQAHGQSVWIDYLSRPFVEGGELAGLVREGVTGVTSNPTIFQGAIAEGESYDDQLREVLRTETDPKEVFLALARTDIRRACDLLHDVWSRGGADRDGWVSLEVDPTLAHDTEATVAEAARLHEMVERPNLFVKIPATKAGLPAIEETIARGIPVNVTLIFSLERHREVAEAYIA